MEGFWLLDAQALHEPAILLQRQLPRFISVSGPLKAATFQSLVQKEKAISLPVQRLDPIPSSATEQKQCVCKWIQLKLLLDHDRQTVNAPAKVGISAGNVNLPGMKFV